MLMLWKPIEEKFWLKLIPATMKVKAASQSKGKMKYMPWGRTVSHDKIVSLKVEGIEVIYLTQ